MAGEKQRVFNYSEAGGQLRFAADQLRVNGQPVRFDRDSAKTSDGQIGLQPIDELSVLKQDGVTIITGRLTEFHGIQASHGLRAESLTAFFRINLGHVLGWETVDVWGKAPGQKKFRSLPNQAAAELMGNVTHVLRWMKTHPAR